jgi:hypothetical protein
MDNLVNNEARVETLQQGAPSEQLMSHSQYESDVLHTFDSSDELAESEPSRATLGKSAEGCTDESLDSEAMQAAQLFSKAGFANLEGRPINELLKSIEDGMESHASPAVKAAMYGVYLTRCNRRSS